MSEWVQLKAADGHELSAYIAKPEGKPLGALVVIQEIFGVNAHIRSVADGYAKDGFLVIAPALFDRIEKGVELKYEGEDRRPLASTRSSIQRPPSWMSRPLSSTSRQTTLRSA
jgi:carboxymethylenebutenolidase